MEIWVLFALLSAVAAGVHNFMFKIVVERNYDPNLVNGLGYILGVLCMWWYLLYLLNNWVSFTREEFVWVWIFAFCNSLFFNFSILSRVESMRNIDTVIFFPLYKTFGPLCVTMISLFIFWESLTYREVAGIILGICIPLMLLTKIENRIQNNLFLGFIMMLVTVIFSTLSASSAKAVAFHEYSLDLFIFLTFLMGMIMSLLSYRFQSPKKRKKFQTKWLAKTCSIVGVVHIASFFFFSKALVWNFAVVFTINSFSILIPIILSIIFYWEHFNLKKGIVIALSIISILLFI